MKTQRKYISFFIFSASISSIATAAPLYTATSLDANFVPVGINASGVIVGSFGTAGNYQAAYYDGTIHSLGTLSGGTQSFGFSINNSGVILGQSYTANDYTHTFIYDGSMHDLGRPLLNASAINNSGLIAGTTVVNFFKHAVIYDGTTHDLGTLNGSSESIATDINSIGVVAGYSGGQAFLYDGSIHGLGKLTQKSGSTSQATAVNDSNNVVGWSDTSSQGFHAFLYSNGTIQDLGTLGGTYSFAHDINNLDAIVGWSYTGEKVASPPSPACGGVCPPSDVKHAFLYDGTWHDLNSLLLSNLDNVSLEDAIGINDSGQIITLGSNNLYYLLTPSIPSEVPLPASAWLFGSCLTGLISLRRKLKNS